MYVPMCHPAMSGEPLLAVGVVVMCLVLLAMTVSLFRYGFVWLRALLSGAYVSIFDLMLMAIRRVPSGLVVDTYIRFVHAGVAV